MVARSSWTSAVVTARVSGRRRACPIRSKAPAAWQTTAMNVWGWRASSDREARAAYDPGAVTAGEDGGATAGLNYSGRSGGHVSDCEAVGAAAFRVQKG